MTSGMIDAITSRCMREFQDIEGAVPAYWQKEGTFGPAGAKWRHKVCSRKTVIVTVSDYPDGRCWIHASIADEKQIPEYGDLMKLKREFIGDDRKAVMVLPKLAEHVNIHDHCLHLFCCLDEDPLPDFTRGSRSL